MTLIEVHISQVCEVIMYCFIKFACFQVEVKLITQ